jgi:hypothetical protein
VTPPASFSLQRSEFNAFLFAEIVEAPNGMPLSLISALARLDLDPWEEAARLSKLPRRAAALGLASILSRLPEADTATSPAARTPRELVELLPAFGPAASAPRRDGSGGPSVRRLPVLTWIICLLLVAATLYLLV